MTAKRRKDENLKPMFIDSNTWAYIDKRGLLVVHETRDLEGIYIGTDQFVIPRRIIKTYLKAKVTP